MLTKSVPDKSKSEKVTFIGLGGMGYSMMRHCATAGKQVVVYNSPTTKAKAWVKEYEGEYALTRKAAAEFTDVVLICVGNDDLRYVR